MIRLKQIKKYYGKKKNRFLALDISELQVEKGEMVAIIGKSGCGKSTLLNIIGTVDTIDDGDYYLNDILINSLSEKKKANLRSEQIGFIIQSFGLLNDYTVRENILLPVASFIQKSDNLSRYEELTRNLDIQDIQRKYPDELSGGQQQRVAIARALINNPDIILADEPTGNLDRENSALVIQQLIKENQLGKTICIVTHDEDIAKKMPRIIRLEDGHLAF